MNDEDNTHTNTPKVISAIQLALRAGMVSWWRGSATREDKVTPYRALRCRASRLSRGGLCLLLLTGCRLAADGLEPAVAVTNTPANMPAPISVAAQALPAESPEDPVDRIRARFREIGGNALLVVQARVQPWPQAGARFPRLSTGGRAPQIATTLTLEISQVLCGPPGKEVLVTYPGGRLPNGQFERTDLMPRDPAVDEEYVFFLRRVGREYFLELGRDDMLTREAQGVYLDPERNRIPLDRLKGLCP